jgi:Putative Ig domain/Secretion system C-terminal sorting domain
MRSMVVSTIVGTALFSVSSTAHAAALQAICPEIDMSRSGNSPRLNQAAAITILAEGGAEPYTFTATGLPSTLTINTSTGLISGAPTQLGVYAIVATATDANGCVGSYTFNLSVTCAIVGLESTIAEANPYVAYSSSLVTTGGLPPYTYTLVEGELPEGYLLGTTTGVVKGTTQSTGVFNFAVRVTDAGGCEGLQDFSITVDCGSNETDVITLPDAVLNQTYTSNVFTQGSGSFSFSFPATIPGLSFSDGQLTGTPTFAGTYSFTASITNIETACTVTRNFSLTVACPSAAFTTTSLTNGTVGADYEQLIAYTEGLDNPSLTLLTGVLPPGLELAVRGLGGEPTTAGVFTFSLLLTHSVSCSIESAGYSITIVPPVRIVKPLQLTSLCAESEAVRNWRVRNTNDFEVPITWEVYPNLHTGSLTAAVGDSFFTTPNTGGVNTVKIYWYDENDIQRSTVKASSNQLCDPVPCTNGLRVYSYQQGLRKDGKAVSSDRSNPLNTLGSANAKDSPQGGVKFFSLGFGGNIVIELDNPLYDQLGNDLRVTETSYGNPSFFIYPEQAEIFVSMDAITWVSLGLTNPANPLTECATKLDSEFDLAEKIGWAKYVKVLDVTNKNALKRRPKDCTEIQKAFAFNAGADGFDVDAIECLQPTKAKETLVARDVVNNTVIEEDSETIYVKGTAKIFPNPTADYVQLDFSEEEEFVLPEDGIIQLNMVDMRGNRVYNSVHSLDEGLIITTDIRSLSSGLYVMQAKAGNVVLSYKVIKK